MKKSRFLVILAALTALMLCVFGLFACGGGEAEKVSVTGITVTPQTVTVRVGGTFTLDCTVTPDDATDKSVIWLSSAEDIATVSNGVITGVKAGKTTVMAETTDGHKKALVNVTVTDKVDVTGVTLDVSEKTVVVGDSFTLTATVAPADATNKGVVWTSSAPAVASVENGVVNALSAGSADITVKTDDGEYTAKCAVTVTTIAVTGVSLNVTTAAIGTEQPLTLKATVAPADATNTGVVWTSSAPAVATVLNGVVTGVAPGSADITVKTEDGNYQATCTVTVSAYKLRITDTEGNPIAGGKVTVYTGTANVEMTSGADGIVKTITDSTAISVRDIAPNVAAFEYEFTDGAEYGYFYNENNGVISLDTSAVKDYVYELKVSKYVVAAENWLSTNNALAPHVVDKAGIYATTILPVDDLEAPIGTEGGVTKYRKKPSSTIVRLTATGSGKKFTVTLHSSMKYTNVTASTSALMPVATANSVDAYLKSIVLDSSFDVYLHAGEYEELELSSLALPQNEGDEYGSYSYVITVAEGTLPAEGTTELYPYVALLGKDIDAAHTNTGDNKDESGSTYFVLDVSLRTTIDPAGSGKVKVTYTDGSLFYRDNRDDTAGYKAVTSGSTIELMGSNCAMFRMDGATGKSSFKLERVYDEGDVERPYTLSQDVSAGGEAYSDVRGLSAQSGRYKYVEGVTFAADTEITVSLYNIPASAGDALTEANDHFKVVYFEDGEETPVVMPDNLIEGEYNVTGTVTVPAGKKWYVKVWGGVSAARVVVSVTA